MHQPDGPLPYQIWVAEFENQLDTIASLTLRFVADHTDDITRMWAVGLSPRDAAVVVLDRADALFQE